MKLVKNQIILLSIASAALLAASINTVVYTVRAGKLDQWRGVKTDYVFEAESAELSRCIDIPIDPKYNAGQNAVVGYIQHGGSLTFHLESKEKEEDVNLSLRVSSPLGWVGVFNLPQSFDFDGLYTLSLNGEEIPVNSRFLGSNDVSDHGNYYYWVNANVSVNLLQGMNILKLEATNRSETVYASFGNVDSISLLAKSEIIQHRRVAKGE